MMKREERKNMIEFIEKKKGLERDQLTYMTDEEVEHIYNVTYFMHEEIAE
ncbi:BH0509 family protein [Microbacteriaceae bacterium 4G12]